MNEAAAQEELEEDKVSAQLYRPHRAEQCSEPLYRFIKDYGDLVGAFFFTVMAATRIDEVRTIAARALAATKTTSTAANDTSSNSEDFRQGTAFKRVQKYGPLLSRNLVVGMANNFFSYVSEMLQIVLRRKPEALRSSERLTNEEVLQFTRIKELIAYMADKKVNELAYGGIRGVEDYVRERLGVTLFDNEDERLKLTVLAELRNIHTHNRGAVNEIFLKRVGQSQFGTISFREGEVAHADFDQFIILSRNAIDLALRLDTNLAKKFGIRRRPYGKRRSADNAKEAGT